MKFVYFGYDFMLNAVQRLINDGHELIGVFSFPCDNLFNFNTGTLGLAQRLHIPASIGKPEQADIDRYVAQGCDCFLSAGYLHKIPPIDEKKCYGINLHPSFLPKGRGLMPTPYIIMDHPDAAGVSAHKLTDKFDEGDILLQRKFTLTPQETVETLSARIAICAPDMLSSIFGDIRAFWNNAKPQNPNNSIYFPPPTEAMRHLDWNLPVERLDKIARAFGRYGTIAVFDGKIWIVYNLSVWPEKHSHQPGAIVTTMGREIIIAASDGYVCLKDFQISPVRN